MDRDFMQSYWWMLLIRGIVALLFGFAAIFWPGLTLLTLIYLLSVFLLVSGLVDIVVGIASVGKGSRWFLTLLLGLVQLGFGVYLVRHLAVTIATFILIAGFVLIFRGVLEIISALLERVTASERTMSVIGGFIAALAGVIILMQPAATIAFVWILGLYALIVGPLLIATALDVKATASKAR
jgi:uncharacterized membrane protein HdeD (DUF308 family)